MLTITQVDGILLLDHQGERIAVNYYQQHCAVPTNANSPNNLWEDVAKQKALERNLTKELDFTNAKEGSAGCRIVDGYLVNYYIAIDFAIVVLAPSSENEVLLSEVCTTLKQCLVSITDDQMNKEVLCTKLDSVFLLLDDIVDGGIIMEANHSVIIKRLKGKSGDGSDHVPLNQAIYNIRNNVIRNLLNSEMIITWLKRPTILQNNAYWRANCLRIQHANFGTKRVTQKRRYMLKLIHPEEKKTIKVMTEGRLQSDDALPKSLLCSSAIRKLVYSNTVEAQKLANKINWDAYKSNVRGVRWHPSGSWYVQFNRRNYEKNFFVNCHCYFSVEKHGFQEAKQKAIAYRKRLEAEYEELQETWNDIDRQRMAKRMARRDYREKAMEEEEFLLADSTV
ncbi:Coatomer subunit zeta-3 [Babesia sp. Xinjiang]|uniref:Coatomer subunit zeta-3 n=1 Tax=Babesia sp. Xinjiang TaxID=462227 RepID=UPI000A241032|nr:Coatomer subunit zeta-3 [Babesia sp. Xinjiang]ORM42130.1 Coatomer subunit zeta-3 [Babesia sp. Xinjiang]